MSVHCEQKHQESQYFYPPQHEPIRLVHGAQHRQKYDKLSDLYSIILSTEHLERMWIKNCIDDEQYTEKCKKLIIKYKTLVPVIQPYYANTFDFFNEYCEELTSAKYRLMDEGDVPNLQPNPVPIANQAVIAETVQYFITIIDALELKICAVDELYPELKRLSDSLAAITSMKHDHPSKTKANEWLYKLQDMKAMDQLTDDEMTQIKFDIANAYDQFHAFLKQ
eukprot:101701_1